VASAFRRKSEGAALSDTSNSVWTELLIRRPRLSGSLEGRVRIKGTKNRKERRMKCLTRWTISSLCLLSFVAAVGAAQQQTTRATVRIVKDRPAAPSFGLADASGKLVHLTDFRGKPVVLNLWATDCGGCRAELPTFVEVSQRYKGPGLTVLGVSMDIMYADLKNATEGWARVKPFVAAHGMKYPILLDDGSVEKVFHVTALPATYLIDRAGRIAATYIGVVDSTDLEANIRTILAER
jgi:peroxiredoxin